MKKTLALAALAVLPMFGQLAAPNAAGVAFGHMHLNASDVDTQIKFWALVGGNIVQREKITMAQFPGIYILIRKQDYSGGSVGSTINHFGFYVRDFEPSVAKWKAAGLTWEPVKNPNVGQGFLTGPDNVRIEIYENKAIPTPRSAATEAASANNSVRSTSRSPESARPRWAGTSMPSPTVTELPLGAFGSWIAKALRTPRKYSTRSGARCRGASSRTAMCSAAATGRRID